MDGIIEPGKKKHSRTVLEGESVEKLKSMYVVIPALNFTLIIMKYATFPAPPKFQHWPFLTLESNYVRVITFLGLLQYIYGKKYNGHMWNMVKDSINQKGRDLKAKKRKLNDAEESDEF